MMLYYFANLRVFHQFLKAEQHEFLFPFLEA